MRQLARQVIFTAIPSTIHNSKFYCAINILDFILDYHALLVSLPSAKVICNYKAD